MKKVYISLDTDAVLKGQGADPEIVAERNPGLLKIAKTALDIGMPLINPDFFSCSLRITSFLQNELLLENGISIKSSKAAHLLCGANAVEMVICTIGAQLEKKSTELFNEDVSLALALDGLANAAVDKLMDSICNNLEAEAQAEGMKTSTPVSPGSKEWPLEIGQPILFGSIKPDPHIIRLSDSFLMIPKKSSSFIVGIGKDVTKTGRTCDHCSARETCLYKIRKNF
jgi:hypothetical protein